MLMCGIYTDVCLCVNCSYLAALRVSVRHLWTCACVSIAHTWQLCMLMCGIYTDVCLCINCSYLAALRVSVRHSYGRVSVYQLLILGSSACQCAAFIRTSACVSVAHPWQLCVSMCGIHTDVCLCVDCFCVCF